MIQNQTGQTHINMHTGNIPQNMNHGGHEVLDVHEVLSGTIGTLNQYSLLRKYVKDTELLDIIDRQYQFIQNEYNITLDCFKSGQDPAQPTQSYKMKQNNDFIYGLTPTRPKKPIQSEMEMSDELVAGALLQACKTAASTKTMAALESTNPVVRRVLADSIPNCIEMAYELSIYQNKHHSYQVPQFSQQDMLQIKNSFAPAQGQPEIQYNNNLQGNMMSNNMMRNNTMPH
jgi:spore coat protein CotF